MSKAKMGVPKIVFWDLEIIPDLQQALKHWCDLSPYWTGGQTLKAQVTSICNFGYKIQGQKKAKIINAWDFPEWETNVNDDLKLCKKAHEILHDADAIIYQNGDRFDLPYLNTRLLIHGLKPLPKMITIDIKKLAKSRLFLLSNSLKNMSELLTDNHKMDHGEGWQLWVDTHNRKKKAMNIMARYCKQDVEATESVFERLRPFADKLPNKNLWLPFESRVCPSCGSSHMIKSGTRVTKTNRYQRYRCEDCGSYMRSDKHGEKPRLI